MRPARCRPSSRDAAAGAGGHRGRFCSPLRHRRAPEDLCLSPRTCARASRRRVSPTSSTSSTGARSFVFVGFGPEDPDLRMVTAAAPGRQRQPGGEHFLLCTDPGAAASSRSWFGAELGLTPVAAGGGLEEACDALAEAWDASPRRRARPTTTSPRGSRFGRAIPPTKSRSAALRRAEAAAARRKGVGEAGRAAARPGRAPGRAPASRSGMLREVGRIFETELDAPERAFTALSDRVRPRRATTWRWRDDLLRLAGQGGLAGRARGRLRRDRQGRGRSGGARASRLELARIHAEELNQLRRCHGRVSADTEAAPAADGASARRASAVATC